MKRDNLPEDLPIKGQKFALLSIVGPHVKAKTDVWGVKIRGVVEDMNGVEKLVNEIKQYDNKFDIYAVEVGKFVPLNISPDQVQDMKYLDDQLNELVGTYFKEHKDAEIYNKQLHSQRLSNPKHDISECRKIFAKIDFTKKYIEERKKQIASLEETLENAEKKFETFPEEERQQVIENYNSEKIDSMIEDNKDEFSTDIENFSSIGVE